LNASFWYIWLLLPPTTTGKRTVRLSDTVDYPEAFALATDAVIQEIRMSTCKKGAVARALIHRIDTRDLYESVGEVRVPPLAALPMASPRAGLVVNGFGGAYGGGNPGHARRPLLSSASRRASIAHEHEASGERVLKSRSRSWLVGLNEESDEKQISEVVQQLQTPAGLNRGNVTLVSFAVPMSEDMDMCSSPLTQNKSSSLLASGIAAAGSTLTPTSQDDSSPDHIHQPLTQDTPPAPNQKQTSAHRSPSSLVRMSLEPLAVPSGGVPNKEGALVNWLQKWCADLWTRQKCSILFDFVFVVW
jgi:hypothetical protein